MRGRTVNRHIHNCGKPVQLGSAGCVVGRGEDRGEVPQFRAATMRPETED